MNVSKKHSLKVIRRFEEDIWGALALKKKPTRVLNYLFEAYQNNHKYRKLLRYQHFFLSKKKSKFLYKIVTDEKEFRRRKRTIKINSYLNLLKLRRFYGCLGKRKFKRVFQMRGLNSNVLGRSFPYFLESRLDIVLYRANFFDSVFAARQYINHKKVYVNGLLVTKPGYKLFIDDIVSVDNPGLLYKRLGEKIKEGDLLCNYPNYLEVNYKLGCIILTRMPSLDDLPYPFFAAPSSLIHNFKK